MWLLEEPKILILISKRLETENRNPINSYTLEQRSIIYAYNICSRIIIKYVCPGGPLLRLCVNLQVRKFPERLPFLEWGSDLSRSEIRVCFLAELGNKGTFFCIDILYVFCWGRKWLDTDWNCMILGSNNLTRPSHHWESVRVNAPLDCIFDFCMKDCRGGKTIYVVP